MLPPRLVAWYELEDVAGLQRAAALLHGSPGIGECYLCMCEAPVITPAAVALLEQMPAGAKKARGFELLRGIAASAAMVPRG